MNMIDCATKLTKAYCEVLKKSGINQVGRYLPTTEWKALSKGEVDAIKETGLQLISIFEKGSTKASYFTYDQGVQDAKDGSQMAKDLGQTEGTAIYFTVDYDAQTKDFAGILNYFQGLKDTMKTYKIGAYGKFDVIVLLQTKKLADYFWQTYAWSHGQKAKNIHLFQYKNDTKAFGLSFGIDINQIENAVCGSWGKTSVKPIVKPVVQVPVKTSTYKVVSGDTLSEIAEKFKTTTTQLKALNHLADENKIYVGQVLKVSGTASKPPDIVKYKIQDGDNLTILAKRHKTTIDYLMHINPTIKNPNKIYIGQVINVPR
jgi:LysM repeat protein